MAGENATLSVAGHGRRRVVVTRIVHGLTVYPGGATEDRSRSGKAFLSSYKETSGALTLDLIFTSYEARESFTEWMRSYLIGAAHPRTPTNPMEILVPVRNFHRVGIPTGDLPYGDRVGAVTYKMTLPFIGTRNVTDYRSASKFTLPKDSDIDIPYLYPAGKQPAGLLPEEDYEYGDPWGRGPF